MPNLYASKRPHRLHLSADSTTFRAAFETHLGCRLSAFLDGFVPEDVRRATVLVGSIPEGIANEVSDIDLMVALNTDRFDAAPPMGMNGCLSVKLGSRGGLELAIISGVFGGLEIDIALIAAPCLAALCNALDRGSVALREDEVRVLSRLRRGWPLECDALFPTDFSALYDGSALQLYCATNAYAIALKRLEDAFAAAGKDQALAVHLARFAVEQGFFAYLASQGQCSPSAKWISSVRRLPAEPVLDAGLSLLFPEGRRDVAPVASYLVEVQNFVREIRGLIERDVGFRIAFDFCPQIYEPDFEAPETMDG
jgi:hypothetical protein